MRFFLIAAGAYFLGHLIAWGMDGFVIIAR
jgi:hypothetical protein